MKQEWIAQVLLLLLLLGCVWVVANGYGGQR